MEIAGRHEAPAVKEIRGSNDGNITGSNALAGCRLGVVLGTQHSGHALAEKWAALADEEVTAPATGRCSITIRRSPTSSSAT